MIYSYTYVSINLLNQAICKMFANFRQYKEEYDINTGRFYVFFSNTLRNFSCNCWGEAIKKTHPLNL